MRVIADQRLGCAAMGTRSIAALVALAMALAAAGALAACGDDDEETGAEGVGGAIEISEPESGASVASPVTVAGSASVFEGTVQIRIRGADGEEIASGFATASAAAPKRGEFSKRVEFSVEEAEEGTIEAYEVNVASEGEGPAERELGLVEVPVTLEP
jgi:hypothetical protein